MRDGAEGKAEAVPAAVATAECVAPRKLNILVVDDNHDSATSLALILEMMGHQVKVANDGPQALAAVAEHRPELMFLDIGLPGMSGYEVARQLRASAVPEGLRIVALSGYGTAEDMKRSKEAGFDQHIVKPIDFERLNRIVAEKLMQ